MPARAHHRRLHRHGGGDRHARRPAPRRRDAGAGLLGSGTHPAAAEGEAEITDKERYERIRDLLGDAVATPVGGLHIHVGMPDAETAIRAFNGLRRHLPLLQALAANSPFRHGRDTGLASAREVTIRGWPRSGVPRAMRDFEDFCATAALLARAADVPDYTWFWWKLRPHPRLGTVEVRALDAQASLDDTAGLVALAHCLARDAASADPEPDPPAEVLEEGAFRAARFGVGAQLPDAEGSLRPVTELLDAALEVARPHGDELGCAMPSTSCPGSCAAAAAPGASGPCTRSPVWGRCCASSPRSPPAGAERHLLARLRDPAAPGRWCWRRRGPKRRRGRAGG